MEDYDYKWAYAVQYMINNYTEAGGKAERTLFNTIYCTNPPEDDGCPVGICPNPDIAGPLLRIAHYVTALCLTILIFHAPRRVKDAFYYQMSTVYALLVTCTVSLFRQNVTRFHASVASTIALSPVSFYFLFYSIKAFWGEHRLDTVLGKKKYLNRGMVFFAVAMWFSIIVYTSMESKKNNFTQKSCRSSTMQELFLRVTLNPLEIGLVLILLSPWFVLTIIATFLWFISIVLVRKEIWPPGEQYRPKFVTVWRTIGRRYPFVFFLSIGIVPMSFWIWMTEVTMWYLGHETWMVAGDLTVLKNGTDWFTDIQLSFSFGQILALFIAVPPFLQVCQLIPQIWPWFINLTWVTCCWKRKREAKQLTLMEEPDPSYTMAYYTQLEDPVSSEVRNSQFDEGRKESQGSGMRLGPNRYYGS